LEVNALFRLRAAQGVVGMATKHTPARLEAACAKAIAVGDPSYRTIKGILIAGTETATAAGGPAGCGAGVPAFLHGPRALFEPGAGGDLAPVLELNTGPTTSTGTGTSDEAAQA
jgi:hypothetical protein